MVLPRDAAANLAHAVALNPRQIELRVKRGNALRQGGQLADGLVVYSSFVHEGWGSSFFGG